MLNLLRKTKTCSATETVNRVNGVLPPSQKLFLKTCEVEANLRRRRVLTSYGKKINSYDIIPGIVLARVTLKETLDDQK